MTEQIHFGNWETLIDSMFAQKGYSQAYFIVDQQVHTLYGFHINEPHSLVEATESHKSMETVHLLWKALTKAQCDRDCIVICMGGGLTTDIGGFVASTYMRGVQTIYIPTTLLAMVDAAIGGKTGINLFHYKNRIGSFHHPSAIIVDVEFLNTLRDDQWLHGFAELIKHALIADQQLWRDLQNITGVPALKKEVKQYLKRAISIKEDIVRKDFKENGERKKLNFGHTIGHAIESLMLENGNPVDHGHAVAIGIKMEAALSYRSGILSKEEYHVIDRYIKRFYSLIPLYENDRSSLLRYMQGDKKNKGNTINFSLLETVGRAVIDQSPSYEAIELCLQSYIDECKKL